MIHLRQSTAATVVVGVLVDDGDFKSAETVAFDAAGIDVNLIKGSTKSDRSLRVDAGDGYWAHLEDGYHALTLGTGDTDTLGRLRVTFTATGVLAAWEDFMVMPAVAWDALYAATGGAMLVNAVQISGDATAADNAELMFDGTGYAGGTIKLGVDTVAVSGDATAADNAELMFDGTGYAGGAIKLGVDAVAISGDATAADNAELMFDGTGYAGGTTKLAVGAAASVTGSVGSVASYGTLVADVAAAVWATVTKTVTSCSGAVGSVTSFGTLVADIAAAVWATVTKTVTSCSGAVNSVTGLTNATIADAVLDEIMSGHTGSGSFGAVFDTATANSLADKLNTLFHRWLTNAIITENEDGTATLVVKDAVGGTTLTTVTLSHGGDVTTLEVV